MPRLRRVSAQDPGWSRVHHGRGYRYLDADGTKLGKQDVERVKALVIPPAWRNVWISPYPNAHLQAVGTDDAGRRQYLYHPAWRVKRDEAKFDRVIAMAAELPGVRRRLRADLGEPDTRRTTVLSAAVRLVDLGCFRLGSESYTEENGSYGLTTLERRHLREQDGARVFSFVGKSGVEHDIRVEDPQVVAVLDLLGRRSRPDDRLLAVEEDGDWVPVQASDINDHIRELFDLEVTAKDFRTWHATVHVATALADSVLAEQAGRARPATSKTAKAKLVRAAVVSASELLGNTPTVCRSSYVDPRVIDLYEGGTTIAPALAELPSDPHEARDHVDAAVIALLSS
ncbi:MAG: DNA topoisomerase IB (poxvirus type) [uncultured Nocardioidaceae bacterium]|uniref:DNA topoisomerase n=1 Tax=uncultured Nocardioidaceae bacterium TaxID=253824 RepID=A0A6J4L1P3_9ACTN|nr:MAG: DNA topoisomerase IB (poxvirus type) [uncultured Nocardioidaceae bacterium]